MWPFKMLFFPRHLNVWQPLASSTSAAQSDTKRLLTRALSFCFQIHIILVFKKYPCWKNIIHISYHTARFLTARSQKSTTLSLCQQEWLFFAQKQEAPSISSRGSPSPIFPSQMCQGNYISLRNSNVVNIIKKCYHCCCTSDGDNLKSFCDNRNDTSDMLYIETEVCNLESAMDRDSFCLISHFVLFLGTTVYLKAHISSASNRTP